MFILEVLIQNLCFFTGTLLVIVIAFYKFSYLYWKRRNLNYLKPKIPFGNFPNPFSDEDGLGIHLKRIYEKMNAKGWKHGGIFFGTSPSYVVIDPVYAKNILTKDFQYFPDRGHFYNKEKDPLSAHVAVLSGGVRWKKLRNMLSSAFTTSNIKTVFRCFNACQYAFLEKIRLESKKREAVNLEHISEFFMADLIGACTFGPDYENMKEKSVAFKKYTEVLLKPNRLTVLKKLFAMYFSKIAKIVDVRMIPKDVSKYFLNSVEQLISQRESSNDERCDFTQIFIRLKNTFKDISNYEIALQNFLFFLPEGPILGVRRIYFAAYELAKNQEVQDRLRREITEVLEKHNDEITYDSIQSMKYLHQVVEETLRKYPSVSYVTRKCVQDYKIPDEDVVIEKDTIVFVSILGLHHNEKYFPDPDKFDPERFNAKNKLSMDLNAYLPFGQGPRSCPGTRFGLLVLKYFTVSLIKNFKLTVAERSQEDLKLKTVSAALNTYDSMWVNVIEVN